MKKGYPLSVWIMIVSSVIALWLGTGSLLSTISTLAVLLVPTLYESSDPTPQRQRNAGLAGVAASIILPLAFKDRLAILVAIAIMHAFKNADHRPILGSMAMVVVGGTTKNYLYYGILSIAWFAGFATYIVKSASKNSNQQKRTIVLVLSTILTCAVTAVGLPLTASMLIDWGAGLSNYSGQAFGAISNLNGIKDVQTSSALALRLYAKSPRLLRGQVYRMYKDGKWYANNGKPYFNIGYIEDEEIRENRDKGSETVELTNIKKSGIWVPANCELADVPAVRVERNALGGIYAGDGNVSEYTYFPLSTASHNRTPITSRQVLSTAEPTGFLAHLTGEEGSRLRKIAKEWTNGLTTPKQKINEIVRRLGVEYQYSLSPNLPTDGSDPILYFLETGKQGHCELFASSFVLLARACRIPAKYTTGFSVSTQSTFGGYMTGRYSDAHAWAEAWIDGEGWITVDPTPPSWKGNHPHLRPLIILRDLVDYLWYQFQWAVNYLQNMWDDLERADNDEFTWLPYVLVIMALITARYIYTHRNAAFLKKLAEYFQKRLRRISPDEEEELSILLEKFEDILSEKGLKRNKWQSTGDMKRAISSTNLDDALKERACEFLSRWEESRYGHSQTDTKIVEELLRKTAQAAKEPERTQSS